MIAAGEFDAYNRASAELAGEAQRKVRQAISAYVGENPGASAAEVRDFAEMLLAGVAQAYGDAAASLAAEWYDELAEGRRLERAVIEQTYSAEQVDRVARYQARWLERGAYGRFARSCGEYAANHVRESLNRTMMRNVRRDRGRGVRFARVPTGAETCTFCTMLASRGAVYATARNAGEQNHYHRGCDCKIVPSFGDDAVVEGYDPRAYHEAWQEFERIDKMVGEDGRRLGKAERDRLKREWLAGHGMRSKAPAAAWRDFRASRDAALERAKKARTIAEHVFSDDREVVLRESKGIDARLAKIWTGYAHDDAGAARYRQTYANYVSSFSRDAPIEIDDFTKISGKELQLASWLSKAGFHVHFRNADDANRSDSANTSDAYIDGELWEFKRVSSASVSKIARRVTEKLDRQGPNFVVDLSISPIETELAELKISELLNDDGIKKIMLIKSGKIRLFVK